MSPFVSSIVALPRVRDIMEKSRFDVCRTVRLRCFRDIDRATGWCEQQWRNSRHHYRRRIEASERRACFEFASPVVALAFALRFG